MKAGRDRKQRGGPNATVDSLRLCANSALQFGENVHIAVKTGRAERKVFTDRSMKFFFRVLRHANQFAIRGATNPLRVRKCFGQVRPSEFQEFLLVNFPSHSHLSPASGPSEAAIRGHAFACGEGSDATGASSARLCLRNPRAQTSHP